MKFLKVNSIFFFFVLVNLICLSTANAQVMRDVAGKNLRQRSVSDFVGSPLLSEQWSKGVIKFADNTTSNQEIKYDQLEDVVLYKNDKEETLVAIDPIKEFSIFLIKDGKAQEKVFRSGFNAVNDNSDKAFYEIIADNNLKFLKRTIKIIVEEKEYNAGSATKKITDKTYYFVVKSNTPISVSKNEKSILTAIGDRNTELSTYIKTNKLNLKNDGDIIKLFAYYDELLIKAPND